MRKFIVTLAAIAAIIPAMSIPPAMASGTIYSIVTYYDDDNYRNVVGQTTYYCDSTDVTTGLVTSSAVETYHGSC